jgi:hypothetical protein
MIHKKFLHLLWITGMLLLATGKVDAQAQIWYPGHAIGTQNGVYSYNYTQTPSQLVELFPAAELSVVLLYYANRRLSAYWRSDIIQLSTSTAEH